MIGGIDSSSFKRWIFPRFHAPRENEGLDRMRIQRSSSRSN